MRKFILTPLIAILLSFGLTFNSTAQDLMITGVFDGPISGNPKAIELYVVNDIADLSSYGFGSATNGGGTDGEEFTFPADSYTAGDFIYIASESTEFTSYFGFAPTYVTSDAGINGDDAVEIFHLSSVIDVYGDPDVLGDGETWDYTDGWAYRNADETAVVPFDASQWTFSGIDVNDGQTDNASATTPFPVGTFTLTTGPCGAGQSELLLTISGGSYSSEKWVDITTEVDGAGTVIWAQGDGSYGNGAGFLTDESVCVDNGTTYFINAYDAYADGWDGTTYALKDQYGIVVANNGGVTPNDGTDTDSGSAWEDPALELESSESFSYTPASCPPPTDLALDSNNADEATFSWTENGSTSNWNLIYGAPGFDPLTEGTTVAADANPYTITGLSPITEYDVYVQSDCGAGDLSALDGPVNFTTDCGVYTTPFSEDFSTFAPECWSEATGLLADPVVILSSSSAWGADGFANVGTTGAARINNYGTGRDEWLITPEIDLGDGSTPLSLVFDLALTDYANSNPIEDPLNGSDDKFAVVISTDGGTTWSSTNTLAVWDNIGSSYVYNDIATAGENVILDLSAYTGIVKFGFYAESTVSNADNDLFIDNVGVRELSSEADILTFELAEQTAPATIDAGALTVDIEVGGATDVTALTPTITVSNGASISPATGVAQDFTNPVTYSVTAEDGTEKLWEVTVTPAATLSNENDILTFELLEQTGAATIGAGTVDIEVTWDTDVTSLVPTITVSPLATISPESGVAQDFTNPVTYTVTAEDASEQIWTATVTKEPTPAGATCDAAFNYGAVNDPAQTGSIASYEAVWYYVTLTEMLANVNFSLCASDFDTKIEIWDDCEDADYIYYNDDECGSQSQVIAETLDAGTYYVKVYGYSSASGNYELEITGSNCETPTNVDATDILSDAATISWTTGLTETAWNLKVSDVSIDPTLDAGNIFDGVVNTTPEQALTGLAESTDYYVYVQADCGADWTTEYVFTTAAGCPQPANLTANVGVDFAELDWDAFGGTEWNIKISDVSIDPSIDAGNIEDVSATTTKPYTTTVTLDANTTYYFYVQTSCGSDWSDEGMFTTLCEAITEFPYEEGFEGTYPVDCWSTVYANASYPAGNAMTHNTDEAFEGTQSFRFSSYSSGSPYEQYLITPELDMTTDQVVEFRYKKYTYGSESFTVGTSTTGNDITTDFTWGTTVTDATTEWQVYTMPIDPSVKYVAIQYNSNYAYYLYVDNFTIREISSEADFLTYSIPEQISAADINYTANTIAVEVGNGTDLTSLVADYTVSTGASASIGTTPQESGVSINDFSSPVTYSVTAEDGVTVNNWVVTVTEAAVNTETDILTYSFPEETSAATIDATEKTIDIEVAWNADVTALVADFTLSYGATAAVAGTDQESGVTANDFTNPVVYTVTAEDGTTDTDWTVTVTIEDIPMGANCDNPYLVSLPTELPYTHADQSNCGLGNAYSDTELGSYDGGDDAIYEITVTSDVTVDITLDPGTTTWTGIAIFDGCPTTDNMITSNTNSSASVYGMEGVVLPAGTYYIMIDTWPSPDCIDNYTLTISTNPIGDYAENTTLTLTPETQNVASGNDANGVLDIVYPETVSADMPAEMLTDALLDVSELTAGAVIELFDGATSLGTYTVAGGESVMASEAFTGVNRVAASMTEGQIINWDVVISGLSNGTYNVSATLYLGTEGDLTAQTNITEVATDTMEIVVSAPFIDLALISPEGGMYDCGLEEPVNVPVEIENVGNTTIATGEVITLYVDVEGTNEIEEDITLTEDLLPGETLSMETTSTLDFTALGTYNWEVIIDYTGDTDPNNNFTSGYLVHFTQDIEFIGAVNDTITIDATEWPYTIETNLDLSTDSVLVSTYEWEFDGSTETTLTVNAEGWYILHVTTETCETMDSVFVLAYNGIDVNAENEFAVYPNPTHGQFMLEMNLVEKQDVIISIYNSNGQLVREFKFDDIDQFARQINMTDEAEGLYSIRINAGGKLYNKQVVIR